MTIAESDQKNRHLFLLHHHQHHQHCLSCDDDSTVLDLRAIVGCDVSSNMCVHILDYLCGYESDWWENAPSMGALDVADKLGLERLLSSIVRPQFKEKWERGRS